MAIQVFIGGIEYTKVIDGGQPVGWIDAENFQVNEDITTTNKNCQFTLYIDAYTCKQLDISLPRPRGGQECIILNNGVKEFAGVLTNPGEDNPAAGIMEYTCQCKDYEFFFNKRIITNTYNNRTLESIIVGTPFGYSDGIVETVNLSGANFKAALTTEGGYIYPSEVVMSSTKKFDHKPAVDAGNELANYVLFFFYIDYDKNVHFEPVMNSPCTVLPNSTLMCDTPEGSKYYTNLHFDEDVSQIRNQIYLYGYKIPLSYPIQESFSGDGNTNTFTTTYELIHSLINIQVSLNGVKRNNALDISDGLPPQSGTIPVDDGYVYINYTQGTLRFLVAPQSGDVVTVNYWPMVSTTSLFNNPASFNIMKSRDNLDGIYEYAINDPKMTSTDNGLANMRGAYELGKYAFPHYTGTFTSYIQGWSIGTFFYLTSDYRMDGEFQNQIFYIVKVAKTLVHAENAPEGETIMQYTITFSDIPFYI